MQRRLLREQFFENISLDLGQNSPLHAQVISLNQFTGKKDKFYISTFPYLTPTILRTAYDMNLTFLGVHLHEKRRLMTNHTYSHD